MNKYEEKVLVSKQALLEVLSALNGPAHFIRELQVTRNLPELPGTQPNPINILIEDLNRGESL